jgi:secondary thiamine-phosphate synthase enzyme
MQTEIRLRSRKKYELIDLTKQVAKAARESGVVEGLCHVYVAHATAAIVINENDDPNLCDDLIDALDRMIPEGIWRHDRVDNNGAAHIKSAILGPSETLPVRDGKLLLGRWQAIMLVDLDGPRDRRIVVTILGDK